MIQLGCDQSAPPTHHVGRREWRRYAGWCRVCTRCSLIERIDKVMTSAWIAVHEYGGALQVEQTHVGP